MGTRRGPVLLVALALALLSCRGAALGAAVENVRLQEVPGRVLVVYDLRGEGPASVQLVGTGRGGAPLNVRSVSGDVGPGVASGSGKMIVWEVSRDYPAGLGSEDVTLDVVAVGARPAAEEPSLPATYFVVPLRGRIGMEVTEEALGECLAEAERVRPGALVLAVTSPGGLAPEVSKVLKLLADWRSRHPDVRLVALVEEEARSGAAAVALLCPDLFVKGGSFLGAPPVLEDFSPVVPVPDSGIGSCVPLAESGAKAAGHSPVFARASLDPSTEVWVATRGEGVEVLSGEQKRSRPVKEIMDFRRIAAPEQPLNLAAEDAVRLGLARGEAASVEELGARLGLRGWSEAGEAGRRIMEAQQAKLGPVYEEFAGAYAELNESYARSRRQESTLSARRSYYWEFCEAFRELRALEANHPYLQSVADYVFPRGFDRIEANCTKFENRR